MQISLFARDRGSRVRQEDREVPLARLRWLLGTTPPDEARDAEEEEDAEEEKAEDAEEEVHAVTGSGPGVAEAAVPPSAHVRSSPVRPSVRDAALAWAAEHTPATLRGAAIDPGSRGVRALVVIGIVAALVAAMFFWRARPAAMPAPPVPTPTPVAESASATPTDSVVVVHVGGKVREPGVFTLPAGSRVVDAVEAAGGVRGGGDTGTLNLARRLVDGEQILVGVSAPQPTAVPAPEGMGTAAPQLDLNTATTEELEELPGIGPVLAERIVEYRAQHGGFRSVDQLQGVSGIGPKRFADIKDEVRV